jgi:hypothetical protein
MKKEVKQGFPLAPYLFILMGKIFNFMLKRCNEGRRN